MNINFSESVRKYEERIRNIMQLLAEISIENPNDVERIRDIQKRIEEEMIEFEKLIDEECMNRTIATHRVNMALINKLRELKYDFNQEKQMLTYDSVMDNVKNMMKNINL